MKKKISLKTSAVVLTEKEMMKVLGGGSCLVQCSGESPQIIYCLGTSHCIDKCWEKCGIAGWMTNCY
ncbi:hypothetical protein LJC43_06470 [Parabacteroides sp. OttesenSCG-928-G21]|nr:hypothetical protein [Parabacteroides sp. OttesenSCG-928-G21]